jgi:hypothetical protein
MSAGPSTLSPEVVALLPQLGQQPAAVADQLKALADGGDDDAAVLAAWSLVQAGRWQEGIPYAERAAALGAVQVAANYVGNMIGSPEHRDGALRLLSLTMDSGWPVDPLGWLPTFAQRGDMDGAAQLVHLARAGPLPLPEAQAERLVERLRDANRMFDERVDSVDRARREAIERIEDREGEVNAEVERLAALGHKVETLAHEAASEELARQYARQAERNEKSAFWFTAAALLVGAAAAGVAAYFTLKNINHRPDIAEGLAKAGIAIPVALFATFLARLASRFRQMAWRWRHVELQLRTAEPYIAELGEEQRTRMIETLALRFFPGQSMEVSGSAGVGGQSGSLG